MNALLLAVTLVFTPEPWVPCEGHRACAIGNTVYLRGTPLTREFDLDPAPLTFPHFYSGDIAAWRRCGKEIGRQAGLKVEFNRAHDLCHEIKHVLDGRSHNQ